MKRSFVLALPLIFSLGLAAPVYAEELLPPEQTTAEAGTLPEQTVLLGTETALTGTETVLPGTEAAVFPAEEPATAQFYLANGKEITDDNIREIIYGLKAEYPEGRSWTNDNSYYSPAAHMIGGGCEGFALICTDAAFGDLPISRTHSDFDAIRVGDVARVNNDTHAVVVLEKHPDSIVIAEGNYNHSIHWGRRLTRRDLENGDFYVRTRYPEINKITLSRAACVLRPGELTALFLAVDGNADAAGAPIWTSSDRRVVDVDAVGWIRGVSEGTATITVKAGGLSVSCTVTVDANAPGTVQ